MESEGEKPLETHHLFCFICIWTDAPFSGDPVQAESSVFPEFNRTFKWDLKTDFTHTFQLDFPEQGLRQISSEETCPDEHKYSFIIYLRGQANIGTFCRGGSVTTIQGRYRGRVSLKVPANAKMDPFEFKLSGGPETNSESFYIYKKTSDKTDSTINH